MHHTQFKRILRDAEVAVCISPIVQKHHLSEEETKSALVELHVPRAANIARISSALNPF
ncbi:MAG TPA: hypothetical protein VGI60_04055 [Chthoniobacterales bacterium]